MADTFYTEITEWDYVVVHLSRTESGNYAAKVQGEVIVGLQNVLDCFGKLRFELVNILPTEWEIPDGSGAPTARNNSLNAVMKRPKKINHSKLG